MKPLLDSLAAILQPTQIVVDANGQAPYLREWRGKFNGQTLAVLRPDSTQQVSQIVQLCAKHRVGIVPQGGNTGACGGAAPSADGSQVVLSLENLNRIRHVRADDFSLTAEAGCTLATIQQQARDVNRLFALDIAPADTCQIGGNLATNCGGVNVLRYGNVRAQCLGLEAVLPNGDIWHGLTRLRKDNRGYDLRDLLIGAEGTLGVITAATLKLHPKPVATHSAWLAVPSPAAALQIFNELREQFGNAVSTCELMPQLAVDFAVQYQNCLQPKPSPWHLLVELEQQQIGQNMRDTFASYLQKHRSVVLDDAAPYWHIRKSIPYAQRFAGGSIKHDVSVAVNDVPDFLAAATKQVKARLPDIRVCAFGHLGDGNIHFNLSQPATRPTDKSEDKSRLQADFLARWDEFNEIVHDVVAEFGGSFAAEHGVGQLKTDDMRRYQDPAALAAMQSIKRALDPFNIMNPGKVIPEA